MNFSLLSIISPLAPFASRSNSRSWSLSTSGSFSVSSFLAKLSFSSPPYLSTFPFKTIWFPLVPSKFQGFLWVIAWGRALTQDRFQIFISVSSLFPHICLLRFTNSKSNDHLFIHCPFTWTHWGKLFHLINVKWVASSSTMDLISSWKFAPILWKARKI